MDERFGSIILALLMKMPSIAPYVAAGLLLSSTLRRAMVTVNKPVFTTTSATLREVTQASAYVLAKFSGCSL